MNKNRPLKETETDALTNYLNRDISKLKCWGRLDHFQKVELAGGLMVLTKTAPAAEQEITLVDRFWSEFHSLRLQVQSRLHKRWHQWTRKQ